MKLICRKGNNPNLNRKINYPASLIYHWALMLSHLLVMFFVCYLLSLSVSDCYFFGNKSRTNWCFRSPLVDDAKSHIFWLLIFFSHHKIQKTYNNWEKNCYFWLIICGSSLRNNCLKKIEVRSIKFAQVFNGLMLV